MERTWLDRLNAAIEEAWKPEEKIVRITIIRRTPKPKDEYRFENGTKFKE